VAYSVSILLGAVGFALIPFCHDQYLQILPFLLIGCVWAAMLACPFTLVTNALQGYGHMGAYLGLFNCAICLPQIIAAACGGTVFGLVGGTQSAMMFVSAVLLAVGAACVFAIKDGR
jgi:maltose/moltooligosaccharide transporter